MITKYDYDETPDWAWYCVECGGNIWFESHYGEFIRCEECLRCMCGDTECRYE